MVPAGWYVSTPLDDLMPASSKGTVHSLLPENRTEEPLYGLPVPLGSVCVIARHVGHGKAVVGLILLDGVDDSGRRQRSLRAGRWMVRRQARRLIGATLESPIAKAVKRIKETLWSAWWTVRAHRRLASRRQ